MQRWVWSLVALCVLGAAWADGIVVPEQMAGGGGVGGVPLAAGEVRQRAVLHWRDGVETLVLDVGYRGPAGGVAWLVPVPARPGPDDLFVLPREGLEVLTGPGEPERSEVITAPRAAAWRQHPAALLSPELWYWYLDFKFRHRPPGAPAAKAGAAGAPGGPGVVVHQRRQVDVYDLAVLEARTGADLAGWLTANRFLPPAGLAAYADEYLRHGWSFVAVRLPAGQADVPVMTPLLPLGLRFASPQPVFPLLISRLTSPPRMVLDLLVYTPTPVNPTAPSVQPLAAMAGGGERLDARRLRLCREQGNRTLVTVADLPLGPYALRPTFPGIEALTRRGVVFDGLHLTRLWGLLAPEAMVDLRFAERAATPAAARLTEHARREVRLTAREHLWRCSWLPVLVAWLAAVGLVRPLTRTRTTDGEGTPRGLWAGTTWRFVAVWLLATVLAGLWRDVPRFLTVGRTLTSHATLPVPLMRFLSHLWLTVPEWILPVAVLGLWLTVASLRRRLPSPGVLALGVLVLVVIGRVLGNWVMHAGLRVGFTDAVLSLALWPWAAWLVGRWDGTWRDAGRPAWNQAVVAGMLAGVLAAGALAVVGRSPERSTNHADLVLGTRALAEALRRCGDDTGALPARLADLTAPGAPANGVDASGNPVALAPRTWHGPYLKALPLDPTTGRRDTWWYEPTSERLVEGGVWDEVTVRADR